MEIGAVIRKHRLEKNLTQEEVARRLGVTAPAVNKWEKGNSMPDITLLSPLARLLNITLDTLLSHTDFLCDEDANNLILAAHDRLEKESFETVFEWAKAQLHAYPNSAYLSLYMARILQSHLQIKEIDDAEYTPFFVKCYERGLESDDESIKKSAADALYYHYMGCDDFDKAAEYLEYFSAENPERKRKLAAVYYESGRMDEALCMLEELLYAGYQSICSTLQDLYIIAMKDKDFEKAHWMVDKRGLLAQLFEMGEYHHVSPGLELAVVEEDADKLYEIMCRLLNNVESIEGFCKSPLYSHMTFKEPNSEYFKHVSQSLLDCLDEEQFAFTRGDERFKKLRERL